MKPSILYPTLYTPGHKPGVNTVERLVPLINGRNPHVRRLVICTEDAIHADHVPEALKNIELALQDIKPDSPTEVFVRVRNPEVMAQLLEQGSTERLTGFVIPKADPMRFPLYADQIIGSQFRLLPILESPMMTNRQFRELLLAVFRDPRYIDLIECLRIGANDLMGYQGIRRDDSEFTLYDTPVGATVFDILNEFRGMGGFTVTAPVFECFASKFDKLLRKEVRQNILNGLYGQTVIHTRHLAILWRLYAVDREEYESAHRIYHDATAVNGHGGKMEERSTHFKWAELILTRTKLFGLRQESRKS